MLLKNVKTEWAYISTPNQNGKYTVTLRPTEDQIDAIDSLLQETWQDEFGTKKQPAWFGSKKEDDNGVRFVANKTAKYIKDGEEVKNDLKVYDIYANELKDVPNVANGSVMNLSLNAYITEYQGKRGVSLGLQKVQLVSYTVYDGGGDEFEAEAELPQDTFEKEDQPKPTGL